MDVSLVPGWRDRDGFRDGLGPVVVPGVDVEATEPGVEVVLAGFVEVVGRGWMLFILKRREDMRFRVAPSFAPYFAPSNTDVVCV